MEDTGTMKDRSKISKCLICHFENPTYKLRKHIEVVIHLGYRYQCGACQYTTIRNHDLNHHKKVKHEGVLYSCNYCSHKVNLLGTPKRNIKV